jgi:hypothetical protein
MGISAPEFLTPSKPIWVGDLRIERKYQIGVFSAKIALRAFFAHSQHALNVSSAFSAFAYCFLSAC